MLFLFCKELFDRCLIYMREKFAQVKCSAFDDPFFGGGRGEQGVQTLRMVCVSNCGHGRTVWKQLLEIFDIAAEVSNVFRKRLFCSVDVEVQQSLQLIW